MRRIEQTGTDNSANGVDLGIGNGRGDFSRADNGVHAGSGENRQPFADVEQAAQVAREQRFVNHLNAVGKTPAVSVGGYERFVAFVTEVGCTHEFRPGSYMYRVP